MSILYLLIPLFPLLGAVLIALTGRRLGESSRHVGILGVGLSLALSVVAFVQLVLRGEPIEVPLYEFMRCGSVVIDLGLYIDQLTVLLLLLVTGVSFVVHVYSGRYMTGDARYSRFFALTTLFTFAMVTLVMSSNLLLIFACWEIMGICSYLLISHQADRPSACSAATKAFLVNALADVAFLFALILTFATFKTLDVQQILDALDDPETTRLTFNLLGWPVQATTLITLFLFIGCLGKSAQVPFHVWLPNAMEAPTPVSALIHAATMVNAGPYLLVRLSPLVVLSPTVMAVIAIVGAFTALFAAIVSLTQSDIKKILAYSTISQIGFMIMTCGVGAFAIAIFHMLAHGFLKGFLFLSAGNQLEAVAGHGHHKSRTKPSGILCAGALVLAVVPPLVIFSGSYERLWMMHDSSAARITFWVIGLLTVFFTALYLFRGVATLFARTQESPVQPRFFAPAHLLSIAVGAATVIGLLMLLWYWYVPFLGPALRRPAPPAGAPWQGVFPLLLAPLLVALVGWAVGWALFARPRSHKAHARTSSLYVLFLNKFYFDEIYSFLIVQPTIRVAKWLWRVVDCGGIDRLVHGTATVSIGMGRWLWRVIDVRGIDRGVVGSGTGSVGLARWLWRVVDVRRIGSSSDKIGQAAQATGDKLRDTEPRSLQHHLLVMICLLVLLIIVFYSIVL